MNTKIKLTCEFTIHNANVKPDPEQARVAFERVFAESILKVLTDDFTITEYRQEFTDEN